RACPAPDRMPPLISRLSISTPRRSDAALRKICRTSAQTCRIARPECCTERLPDVTPSLGLPAVDARLIGTRPISTSSSSAAIWANAVTMPCPISTFPGETITCPSGEKRTHEDSFGLATRLTGNFGGGGGGLGSVIAPPFRSRRAISPAPCDYVSRIGTGCGPALLLHPHRQARDFVSTAQPRSSICRQRNSRIAVPVRQ